MKPQPNYLPNLTPLRGIAALMVAIYHFEEIGAQFLKSEHSMLIRKSYLMVDLFFVMSGFIMLHVYGESFRQTFNWKTFLKFMRARFARIYPLHFFMLLFLVGIFYLAHGKPSPVCNPAAIPTHLLLLHSFGIHSIYTWNVPSWSISAEWFSYLLFPILVVFLNRKNTRAIIGIFLLAIISYVSIMYFLPRVNPVTPEIPVPHNLDVTYDFGFLRGLTGFIAGLLCYKLFEDKRIFELFSKDLVGLICIVVTVLAMHFGANDLVIIPLFVLLVLSIAANKQSIHTISKIRPLQFIGDISYSIYMIHIVLVYVIAVPIIEKMGFLYKGPKSLNLPFETGVAICIIFLAVLISISSLTYHFIEKPWRKRINKKFA